VSASMVTTTLASFACRSPASRAGRFFGILGEPAKRNPKIGTAFIKADARPGGVQVRAICVHSPSEHVAPNSRR
jgi:hypothetical protein